jgi:hypothetical protein
MADPAPVATKAKIYELTPEQLDKLSPFARKALIDEAFKGSGPTGVLEYLDKHKDEVNKREEKNQAAEEAQMKRNRANMPDEAREIMNQFLKNNPAVPRHDLPALSQETWPELSALTEKVTKRIEALQGRVEEGTKPDMVAKDAALKDDCLALCGEVRAVIGKLSGFGDAIIEKESLRAVSQSNRIAQTVPPALALENARKAFETASTADVLGGQDYDPDPSKLMLRTVVRESVKGLQYLASVIEPKAAGEMGPLKKEVSKLYLEVMKEAAMGKEVPAANN